MSPSNLPLCSHALCNSLTSATKLTVTYCVYRTDVAIPNIAFLLCGTVYTGLMDFVACSSILNLSKHIEDLPIIQNLKIRIYRTIILPVVLYGCEAWSLILREKRRMKVFDNRLLRRVFGPKRDEVTGEWRK
jgi:hypothetical protein